MFGLAVDGSRIAVRIVVCCPVKEGGGTSVLPLSAMGWYEGPIAEALAVLLREAGHQVSIVTSGEYSNGT